MSGQPVRRHPLLILAGLITVTASVVLYAWIVPRGPLGAIVACAILQGAGFGVAWTFILRRATVGLEPAEATRLSGAIPTVQRAGYALGAAWMGIVANAAGLPGAEDAVELAEIARVLFLSCVPFALVGLIAAVVLGRPAPDDAVSDAQMRVAE